jgi:hypothetical protein
MDSNIHEPEYPSGVSNEQPSRPNWSAEARFKEACNAADATHAADLSHKEAVCEALRRTLCLVEDFRGEHKEEIATYLERMGVKPAKLEKDDVLAIVQHVFAWQDKRQWTWHSNALKQALADGATSENLHDYSKKTPPTQAAKKWSDANRKRGMRASRWKSRSPVRPSNLMTSRTRSARTKG